MSTQHVTRRGVFGYAGAATLGGAAGVVAGRASRGAADDPATSSAGGQTFPAHGVHQSGILTTQPAVGHLIAFDLLPRTDRSALGRLMRVWSADIAALMAGRPAPGDSAPDLAQAGASLSILVGLGPRVFDLDGLDPMRPAGFQEIPPMEHDQLQHRWSGGDLLVWISADDATTTAHAARRLTADAGPFATSRWVQSGSWRPVDAEGNPATGRNLFGQVDGTANPTDDALTSAVFSEDGWLSGGTQLVIRRIEMHLDAWDDATRDRQEQSVGRRLDTGAPLTGEAEHDALDLGAMADGAPVIAADAHARRAHPSQNSGRTMLRRGLNYTHDEWADGAPVSTAGLIFGAFQANIAEQYIPVQRMLDLGDALNEWTTAIGSAVFAIPPGFAPDSYLAQGLLE
ncbi:MAG TPA: Dyp-type peroxidase [Arachnia sp.]|nr:Dyp-type peroxidase [Arachnia sp.]